MPIGTRDRVSHPPAAPLLLFDGDCGFCKRWVVRWRAITGDAVRYEPYQEAAAQFPEVPVDDLKRAVHLLEPDGRVTAGAGAAFRAFAMARRHRWLAFAYAHVPGVAPITEAVYRFVASHRNGLDKLDRWALGEGPELPSFFIVRDVFLRCIGLVYFIAFWSMWRQVRGLIGSTGILPVTDVLRAVRQAYPAPMRYWVFPTAYWFNSSDAFLSGSCVAGMALAVALIAGLAPALTCALLYYGYLSVTVAGQDFLGFQWDALLLEAGFLAIFLAPWWWRLSLSKGGKPPAAMIWLVRWLVFRVMFLSGVLKWTSGDVTWRGATAMAYHYQTQPLPAPTSWYAHWLPSWFQFASGIGVFVVEVFVPLLYFCPRRLRILGFWATVVFQCLIMATGNYGFFNLLTIVLCIPLLDDATFPTRWYARVRNRVGTRATLRWRWPAVLTVPLTIALVVLSWPDVVASIKPEARTPQWMMTPRAWAGTYRVANGYGLFRVMTLERPEIVMEASMDGRDWRPYVFRYKAGDVERRPAWCVPHMPRLDWQMWFAALQAQQGSLPAWMGSFTRRLLGASPEALALLERAPFASLQPQYVRAVLYDYQFADPVEHRLKGAWWRRRRLGVLYTVTRGS